MIRRSQAAWAFLQSLLLSLAISAGLVWLALEWFEQGAVR